MERDDAGGRQSQVGAEVVLLLIRKSRGPKAVIWESRGRFSLTENGRPRAAFPESSENEAFWPVGRR